MPKLTASQTIHYYDASAEQMINVEVTHVRSGAGWTGGPSYPVSYRLADGRGYLNGTRHTDRGDLMTDVSITKRPRCTKRETAVR